MIRAVLAAALASVGFPLLGGEPAPAAPTAAEPDDGLKALVFSKTAGFRHDSIPDGIAAIERLGADNGFTVDATERAKDFTRRNLAEYDVVVWLSTTGDVLNGKQQRAFRRYIAHGGGYAGVHAAADTEYDWPWYGKLVGARFDGHPEIQQATVDVEDHKHPSTAGLDATWPRTDEWYNYRSNPRGRVHVLATLDESTYDGGTMGADHPIAWCQEMGRGRSWYTGGGHTAESYVDPDFRRHLLGGIRAAAGAVPADCSVAGHGYRMLYDGTAKSLAGWRMAGPGSFVRQPDGTIASQGGMGLLWYPKRFESYSLKAEWMMPGDDNSGVFVGFPNPRDDPWRAVDHGYEIQIDATDEPDRTTGAVYSFQGADQQARDAALNPPGQWNAYRIKVIGQRVRVYLNGALVNDFTSTDEQRHLDHGFVGLQNHGEGDTVFFRDIAVKKLH